MNKIVATIREIKNVDNLHIIKSDFFTQTLTMISLELPNDLKITSKVELGVKPTNVTIAKNFSGFISLDNQLFSSVVSIEEGKLLACVNLKIEDTVLQSIITLESLKNLELRVGDEVRVFIDASQLSIAKVICD